MSLDDAVAQGLSALSRALTEPDARLQQRIVQYLLLIAKWNRQYNLTAIRNIEDMLYQHIMDSLAAVEYINGPCIVDVGTGAGLPGIPMAIARPDWQVMLLESNQKKTAFLQQVKIELALDNVVVMAKRIETAVVDQSPDTIISRAYASLGDFIKTTQHLVKPREARSRWVAMKSSCTQQELDQVFSPYVIEKRIPLIVPGLSAKRELIVIRRKPVPDKSDMLEAHHA
jgi:16S rRNA (guanine527-N7)-methyltransferase